MGTVNQWIDTNGLAIGLIIIGGAILYYGGGKIVQILTKHTVHGKGRSLPRKDIEKRQKTLTGLTIAIWRGAVVAIAVLSIFKQIFPSLDLAPLFASAGVVGVAIAFGSQTLVKDFLTGLFIVTENQYRVGDVVEINGAEGKVEHLGTRSTVIRDADGNVHYLPNGSIIHVVNKTMGYSRVNFTLSLALTTDLGTTIKLINRVGKKMASEPDWKKMIIETPQFTSIETFSKSGIDVRIIGKVQPSDQWRVTAELRHRLLEEFEKHNILLA